MNNKYQGKVIPIEELVVPSILYKYRRFDEKFHRRTITNCELYIPSANEFNDPYDSKVPFRYNKEDLTTENIYRKCLEVVKRNYPNRPEEEYQKWAFERQSDGVLFDPHHLEQFDRLSYERLCKTYGIFCLTPNSENVLMWSYYSDSHKGFCIGYDTKYLTQCGLFGMGGEIAYRDEFPSIPIFLTDNDHPLLDILFTKWTKWQHETEYRLIHNYGKGKVFTIPKEAILEVVLGCKLSESDRLKFTDEILKSLPHVKIFQIELETDKFNLKKIPINDPSYSIKF